MNATERGRRIVVDAVDYHTAGEPFRIITGGAPPLQGGTILEKRRYAGEHCDAIRKLLVCEPRGHADMYGCFVTEPEDGEADFGVVFFHNAGYSTACGHGTIAAVTWALESGYLARSNRSDVAVVVDAPSGRLACEAQVENDRVRHVRFRNVPSFIERRNARLSLHGRSIETNISYGGAFYASVPASALGLRVLPENVDAFIAAGRAVKHALESEYRIVHPVHADIEGIYGVIFFETLDADPARLHQKNVTIFADGEVDRSPCGSGTSARLAILDADGDLKRGATLLHEGITGERFEARVVAEACVNRRPVVITEIGGSAYLTGFHTFVLQEDDPLGTGFLLR